MRTNQLLLTLHTLAAAAWIGAALGLQVIARRMDRDGEGTALAHFAADAEAVGKTVFAPAAVLLLGTGVALVGRGTADWSDLWVQLGIGAFASAFLIGGAFLIPEGRRIAELARESEHDAAELRRRTRRRFLVAGIDLAILTLAVAVMVFRPGR